MLINHPTKNSKIFGTPPMEGNFSFKINLRIQNYSTPLLDS